MNKTIKKELILLKDLGYRFPTQNSDGLEIIPKEKIEKDLKLRGEFDWAKSFYSPGVS